MRRRLAERRKAQARAQRDAREAQHVLAREQDEARRGRRGGVLGDGPEAGRGLAGLHPAQTGQGVPLALQGARHLRHRLDGHQARALMHRQLSVPQQEGRGQDAHETARGIVHPVRRAHRGRQAP